MSHFPQVGGRTIALDTETTGLEWTKDSAFALALSTEVEDYCFDLREPMVVEWAKENLPKAGKILGYNWKFDLHFLANHGIDLQHVPAVDSMVAASLLNEHRLTYDLDSVAKDYLGVRKDGDIYAELAAIFGGKATRAAQAPNFHRAPWEILSRYAKTDTRLTFDLAGVLLAKMGEEGLSQIWMTEMDLLPVLFRMERHGIRVDVPAAERAVVEVSSKIDILQQELDREAGFPVNVNARTSLETLFKPRYQAGAWILVDDTIAEPTPKGKASLDAECLGRMTHPLARRIVDLRNLLKLRGTFLEGHILGSQVNGRVHANFNQSKQDRGGGTASGRLSCDSPNLQQISKRNKVAAKLVRGIFLPEPGQVWDSGDLSQVEFRIMAHYLNDPRVNRAYAENPATDFHQLVADMTGLPRNPTAGIKGNAKQINLGLSYAMSAGRLCKEMGLDYTLDTWEGRTIYRPGKEGQKIFDLYHSQYPGLKPMLRQMTDTAQQRGYVKNIFGRRLRFPSGYKSHAAGPYLFQSGCADYVKTRLVAVDRLASAMGGVTLINTVHDEISLTHEPGRDVQSRMKECFEDSKEFFRIPILSDWDCGNNWAEASGL
jgi:DNA polymerase I-like protein with 3'-5' exonuclease and polymerase domains